MNKVNKQLCFLAMLVTMICTAFTASASANPGIPIPGTMTATSEKFDTGIATKDLTVKTWVGVQEHIQIQKVPKSKCHTFSTFWNSNYLLGETNKVPHEYKDHNGYLCRDKHSPTGWVKRGGGHTGRDCGNIAQPIKEEPMFQVLPPPSLELKHNSALTVSVEVTANAEASVELWCGTAHGSGAAKDVVQVNYLSYIKAASSEAKLNLFLNVALQAADKAESAAKLSCSYTPPPSCTEAGTCPKPPPSCKETHTCGCEEEGTCPPKQSITITSLTTLNLIAEGKTSGPFYVGLHASEAGGSLTVDPGIGSVSGCESSTKQPSVTFENLPAGNSEACIILYAPSDSDKPRSMTATFTAVLGSAVDIKTQEFEIEYPTRPSAKQS